MDQSIADSTTLDNTTTVDLFDKEGSALARRLLSYVKPFFGLLLLGFILLLCISLLFMTLPIGIETLVDNVLIQQDSGLLNVLALSMVLIFVVMSVLVFISQYVLAFVGEKVVSILRVDLYTHLQRLSLTFYNKQRTGDVVSRMTSDISLVQQAITYNLVDMVTQILTVLIGTGFLFSLNWRLTLFILVTLPLVLGLMFFIGSRINKASSVAQNRLADAANIVEETVSGVRVVKSFARQDYEVDRFKSGIKQVFDAAMYRTGMGAFVAAMVNVIVLSALVIAVWFGGREVLLDRLTVGELTAYLFYTYLVAEAMGNIGGLYTQFQTALGASRRVFGLLDTQPDITNKPDAIALPQTKGEVVFENVSFQYENDASILEDVSFTAESGTMVAIVGPSGAGKSTIVNLVPRFYDVNGGKITIDGHDIRDITLESLNEQIGIVPQETLLFAQSIADNIRYGKLDATQEEIESAAKAANAHHFIMDELPEGYQTMVGERGLKLSGGQRQRIALARAILKDPRILILDEATSSLDSESERLIQEALERLMRGRTSFVIAHRLSTITNADKILVLNNGRLVEQGTHDELLRDLNSVYFRLHQIQYSANKEATV